MKQVARLFIFVVIILCSTHSFASGVKLNRYTSINAWSVNSYWIETDKSIVLIDAQLLKDDALMLAKMIKTKNKPLTTVFITHPHPDHFLGLATLKKEFGSFNVIALDSAVNEMKPAFTQFAKSGFAKQFGDQIDRTFVQANKGVANNTVIKVDNVEFKITDIGKGESKSQMLIAVADKKWLFTGDATMHNAHYYLGEGYSAESLVLFKKLKNEFADYYFYPGHGEPANSAIVDEHINYVKQVRSLVKLALSKQSNIQKGQKYLTQAARQKVAEKIIKLYPAYLTYGYQPVSIVSWSIMGVEQEFISNAK